jgi:hypothetical protein
VLFVIENMTDDQIDSEFALHDLVAQGACYPLAMRVWQQLMPRRPTHTKAKLSRTMIHSACDFEGTGAGGEVEEVALN